MRVLITGAAGRIGQTLARGLAGKFFLRLADLARIDTQLGDERMVCDISDADQVARALKGMDAVVHLAGHPNSQDWDVVQQLNIAGTFNVLKAASSAGVQRILYGSSVHVCGLHPADVTLSNDLPIWPDGPYGISKATCELALRYLSESEGLTCVAMRICSFRPLPQNARELATWISPDDMVKLVHSGLCAPVSGFHTIWGISANTRAHVSDDAWARLGYCPQDNAEDHALRLAAEGVDTTRYSEWPHLGGHFADHLAGQDTSR